MKKAIYPGSFDPITNGHIDIVKRAQNVFDEIYIAVIRNPDKNPLFSVAERIKLIQELFKDSPGIKVESFEGLLVDYADTKQIYTVIRGLRAVSDFDFEFQMALTNRNLNDKIDTVLMMTDEKYSYLSSSIVKQIAQFGTKADQFIPEIVNEALKRKMNHE